MRKKRLKKAINAAYAALRCVKFVSNTTKNPSPSLKLCGERADRALSLMGEELGKKLREFSF